MYDIQKQDWGLSGSIYVILYQVKQTVQKRFEILHQQLLSLGSGKLIERRPKDAPPSELQKRISHEDKQGWLKSSIG